MTLLDNSLNQVFPEEQVSGYSNKMKLTPKEAAVLASVELNADKPIEVIRKETGLRDHTIRYHLHSLEERRIITRISYINLLALGYNHYNLFFSLASHNKKTKDELLKYLLANPSVTWLAELGAEFPIGLGVSARRIFEVHDLLNGLAQKFKGIFFEKAVATQFANVHFPRKYLSSKRHKFPLIGMHRTKVEVSIDETDRKILSGLSSLAHKSRRQLAQKLGMPLSSMELRIKKLEERGVITAHIYGVDSAKFGMQTFKLLIYSKGISREFSSELYAFAESHPRIVYLMECFGNWDYELNVEVENPEDIVGITQELYEKCGESVSSVKVLSKFRDRKSLMFPCAAPAVK